jgi:hypothetical protein
MMFKIRQDLTLQQSPKHLGIVRRFLHGHQVFNLLEGHHPLDPILWASILEDSKLLGVLGGWVVWIHEKLQLDPLRIVRIRPINLVHLLHLGYERNGGGEGFSHAERGKAAEDLENLLMATYSWLLSGLKLFNRSEITVLYVERTIAICDCILF